MSLDIRGFLTALCRAQTAQPPDIAAALGIDIGQAKRVGAQLVLPAPAGTDRFELIVDRSTHLVRSATFALAEPAPLEHLTNLFGTAREAPRGPHERYVTMIFDRAAPPGAFRSCAVLARLPASGVGRDLVASVTLFLHPLAGSRDHETRQP